MGSTQIQYPTYDTVMAVLQEIAERQREFVRRQEETDQQIKETGRQMKETDRQRKEALNDFNKRFGDFTNRFGEIVEYMIAPNLRDKFKELGFIFQKIHNGTEFFDSDNNFKFQVDVMLENGHKAMLVEIKSKLTTEDVKEHIERLEKMRKYANSHDDKRTFLGAVAGVVISSNVKDFALNKGFFVIEPSGETFNITAPHNNPKEW